MTPEETVFCLANVLSIANADGTIGSEESDVIRAIALELGANETMLRSARDHLQTGNYALRLPSQATDRMRNVEDMIMVALADGEFDDREAAPLERVAHVLHYAQADVDMIISRARARLHRMRRAREHSRQVFDSEGSATRHHPPPVPIKRRHVIAPPAEDAEMRPSRRSAPPAPVARSVRTIAREDRGTTAPPPSGTEGVQASTPAPAANARVSRTGAASAVPAGKASAAVSAGASEPAAQPAAAAESAAPSTPPENVGIAIAFVEEASSASVAAVRALEGADMCGTFRRGGALWRFGGWTEDDVDAALALAEAVEPLGARQVYERGKPRSWDATVGHRLCARQRACSEHPCEYCFGGGDGCINPWGCRLIDMPWTATAEWFRIGDFEADDRYVFDKIRLGRLLDERLHEVLACPFLRRDLAEAALGAFPEAVDVWGNWSHHEAASRDEQARSIQVRENVHGCLVWRECRVDGVFPTSVRGALRVLRSALKRCGGAAPRFALLHRRALEAARTEPSPSSVPVKWSSA